MPLVQATNEILFNQKDPKIIVDALMHKGFVNEHE